MLKMSRKVLKESMNDFGLDRDRKAFSAMFKEPFNIEPEDPYNFSVQKLFPVEDSKVFSKEHFLKEKTIRNTKSEIFALQKKILNEKQGRISLQEKISKNLLKANNFKIADKEIQKNFERF